MPLLVDGIVILILLFSVWRGAQRGLLRTLAWVIALFCGLYGGKLIAAAVAPTLAERMILPAVEKAMDAVLDSAAMERMVAAVADIGSGVTATSEELISGVLDQMGLSTGLTRQLSRLLDGVGGDFARSLSEKLAYILVFAIAFLVIQVAAFFVIRMVDAVFHLPIIGLPNKLGGAALGLLRGILLVTVCIGALMLFVPSATASGALLSPETLEETMLTYRFSDFITTLLA